MMNATARSYRAYWATLTGRPESEVYVPRDLQHYWQCTWCGQANPHTSNTCWKCGASR